MADATPNNEKPMMEQRKFKALLLAILVYGVPVVMTFVLTLTKQAAFADLKGMATWMGVALSPAFVAYIGGVALEDYASKRGPTVVPQQAQGDIVNVPNASGPETPLPTTVR